MSHDQPYIPNQCELEQQGFRGFHHLRDWRSIILESLTKASSRIVLARNQPLNLLSESSVGSSRLSSLALRVPYFNPSVWQPRQLKETEQSKSVRSERLSLQLAGGYMLLQSLSTLE